MECRRCKGLMVAMHFIDMEEGGEMWGEAWRCMNCGNVWDATIDRHRTRSLASNQSVTSIAPSPRM